MLKSCESQAVPQVTFPIRVSPEGRNSDRDASFMGKTVVLSTLSGAGTPGRYGIPAPCYNAMASVPRRQGRAA